MLKTSVLKNIGLLIIINAYQDYKIWLKWITYKKCLCKQKILQEDINEDNKNILSLDGEGITNKKTNSVVRVCERTMRPSDRRLLANLVLTFEDRGCHVVSVTDPYDNILGFLDRSRYFFFQVAPQLSHEAEWTLFQTHY
jgi:hypothetical protein